jgi:DNA-binding ferritin-like protein
MYLLFPLKVFQVRKKITKVKGMKEDNPKYSVLIKEIRDDILKVIKEILEHIELIYSEQKIDSSEYNEFGVVISNLTMYLFQEVDRLEDIEEEVNIMVKTFYDPKVEERGRKLGEEKGEKTGILKTKREDVLELLDDIGTISEDIKALVQKEEDLDKLKKWLKLAARAQSIEDFKNKVGLN